jgi:hypothetical protein
MHRSRVPTACARRFTAAAALYVVAIVLLPLSAPVSAGAQAKKEEDALSDVDAEPESSGSSPAAAESSAEAAPEPEPAAEKPAPAPEPPPAPAAPASPFVFTLTGTVAGTMFMQDVPTASGSGTATLYGPRNLLADKWFLGGDVRQARLNFSIRGPEVLAGATPTGVVEVEMFGGNQITSLPATLATVTVKDAMGMTIGTGTAPSVTTSAFGDESLLPRLRTAYVELNWGGGTDILRVGQYHNLLLAQVAASAAHPATLGYGAGQLGWRTPGITYLHKFKLSEDVSLHAGIQINRNSWIDNAPVCSGTAAPPTNNCLPFGISLGEASAIPQVQARLVLSGGKTDSPWVTYAPNVWQVYAVVHWDQKDLSGVGADAPVAAATAAGAAPVALRDTMTTQIIEAGFKLRLGPVLVASNGWYGTNAGGVYGHIMQMQTPDKPDVSGYGAWGQAAFSFTKKVSLWGLAGVDKPNQDQAIAAGFTMLQNFQLGFMLAYAEGPLAIAVEYFYLATTNYLPGTPASATSQGTGPATVIYSANQPSFTVAYSF